MHSCTVFFNRLCFLFLQNNCVGLPARSWEKYMVNVDRKLSTPFLGWSPLGYFAPLGSKRLQVFCVCLE